MAGVLHQREQGEVMGGWSSGSFGFNSWMSRIVDTFNPVCQKQIFQQIICNIQGHITKNNKKKNEMMILFTMLIVNNHSNQTSKKINSSIQTY